MLSIVLTAYPEIKCSQTPVMPVSAGLVDVVITISLLATSTLAFLSIAGVLSGPVSAVGGIGFGKASMMVFGGTAIFIIDMITIAIALVKKRGEFLDANGNKSLRKEISYTNDLVPYPGSLQSSNEEQSLSDLEGAPLDEMSCSATENPVDKTSKDNFAGVLVHYQSISDMVPKFRTQVLIKSLQAQGIEVTDFGLDPEVLSPLYLFIEKKGEAREKVVLTDILGEGGSKRAIRLSNGQALLIPNMDVDPLSEIEKYWPKIVDGEIEMSQFVKKIGLLGCFSQKVTLFLEMNSEINIPAYITDSFASYKNVYIIDDKNPKSSTWKKCENALFETDDDLKNSEKWKPMMNLIIEDIAKVFHYGLPLGGDSVNVAIVGTPGKYQIRYFGFDYTSKRGPIEIHKLDKTPCRKNARKKQILEQTKAIFTKLLNAVIYAHGIYSINKEMASVVDKLFDTYYSDAILDKVYALRKNETVVESEVPLFLSRL